MCQRWILTPPETRSATTSSSAGFFTSSAHWGQSKAYVDHSWRVHTTSRRLPGLRSTSPHVGHEALMVVMTLASESPRTAGGASPGVSAAARQTLTFGRVSRSGDFPAGTPPAHAWRPLKLG